MPKRLADTNLALIALATRPADPAAPTVAELEAGIRCECAINKSDYKLGPTGSSTISEQELCKAGEAKDWGPAAFEGQLTCFIYHNADGTRNEHENKVYNLFKTKGTVLHLYQREGKPYADAIVAGDVVDHYEVSTDTPQAPDDRFSGYIKRTIPLAVLDAHLDAVVKA